jgi:hypothetical protein
MVSHEGNLQEHMHVADLAAHAHGCIWQHGQLSSGAPGLSQRQSITQASRAKLALE